MKSFYSRLSREKIKKAIDGKLEGNHSLITTAPFHFLERNNLLRTPFPRKNRKETSSSWANIDTFLTIFVKYMI